MNGEYMVIMEILKGNKVMYSLIGHNGEVAGTGSTLEESCFDAGVEYWPHKGVVDEVII